MYSEQELLLALRNRDADAFAHLFDTFSDKLYRVAVGILEDETEAEEVVQEAFLRLFERLDQFEGRSTLGTWLYRVAYNAAIDRVRQRRPTISMDEKVDDDELPFPVIMANWKGWPERLLTEDEIWRELDNAIAGLPEKFKAIFILREIEGLTTQETADIAGISISAAKVRLHRARLFLRERLAESLMERM